MTDMGCWLYCNWRCGHGLQRSSQERENTTGRHRTDVHKHKVYTAKESSSSYKLNQIRMHTETGLHGNYVTNGLVKSNSSLLHTLWSDLWGLHWFAAWQFLQPDLRWFVVWFLRWFVVFRQTAPELIRWADWLQLLNGNWTTHGYAISQIANL